MDKNPIFGNLCGSVYLWLGSIENDNMSIIRKFTKHLIALAFTWLFIAVLILLQLWPDLPQTNKQWLLFIAFGPPLYALSEAFFGWFFSEEHGRLISNRQFSVVRIALALFVILIIFIICIWASSCLLVS